MNMEHYLATSGTASLMLQHRKMSVQQRKEAVDRFLQAKNFTSFKQVEKFSENYKLSKELGSGAFGTVKLGMHRATEVPCAIKIIKKKKLAEASVYKDLMMQELEVLEKTIHPHITRIIELLEDSRNYYIIMELVSGGNLLDMVQEERRFTELKAATVMRQLLLALNFMHNKSITHRDLKPENLLCEKTDDGSISIKMTDFGFACYFDPKEKLSLSLGSPLYMAPELCAEVEYDEKVDVWSSGVIMYILLTGQPPFIGRSKDEIYQNIQEIEPRYNLPSLKQCQPSAVDFLQKCMAKDPADRPAVVELLEHEWIQLATQTDGLDASRELDISANIAAFRKTNAFQSGVLSFISNI